MDVEVREGPRCLRLSAIEPHLECCLDAVEDASSVFREALDVYFQAGPHGTAWRQAKEIAQHLHVLDGVLPKLLTSAGGRRRAEPSSTGLQDPLGGAARLLREMKRQVTGFAIEAGVTARVRRVPCHLVANMRELADDVCGAVEVVVEAFRPCTFWWQCPPAESEARNVCWYEGLADKHSTQLIRQVLTDAALDVEEQLRLAQLVEEVDSIADYAVLVDRELRALRRRTVSASSDQGIP